MSINFGSQGAPNSAIIRKIPGFAFAKGGDMGIGASSKPKATSQRPGLKNPDHGVALSVNSKSSKRITGKSSGRELLIGANLDGV